MTRRKGGVIRFMMFVIAGVIAVGVVSTISVGIVGGVTGQTGIDSDKRAFETLHERSKHVCDKALIGENEEEEFSFDLKQTKVLKAEEPDGSSFEGKLAIKLSDDVWRERKLQNCELTLNEKNGDKKIDDGQWKATISCDSCSSSSGGSSPSGAPKVHIEVEER